MTACRPTSWKAMFCDEWRAAQAIGTAAKTRSGKLAAHCSTCMPPIEPPSTQSSVSMPSRSISIACARTMSRMVMTGRSRP